MGVVKVLGAALGGCRVLVVLEHRLAAPQVIGIALGNLVLGGFPVLLDLSQLQPDEAFCFSQGQQREGLLLEALAGVFRIGLDHASLPVHEDVVDVHLVGCDQLGVEPAVDAALLGLLGGVDLVHVTPDRSGLEVLYPAISDKVELAGDGPLAQLLFETLFQVDRNAAINELVWLRVNHYTVDDLLWIAQGQHGCAMVVEPGTLNAVMHRGTKSVAHHLGQRGHACFQGDAGWQNDLAHWL